MAIRLYYEERGQGFPLILLHGNGESGDYFVHQMEYFSRYFRVIAIDTRGHGRSPRGIAPFTIRQFAEDLLSFMDEHEIPQAHLLGFSDGGNIALTFALRHPERVCRLILNGANLNPGGVKLSVQLPILCGYVVTSLFARWSGKAGKNAALLGLMVKEPTFRPQDLHALPVKTLVIVGTHDMIKASHTCRIFEGLPHAALAVIRGDHFIAAKNPTDFNRAVGRFLSCLSGK